MIEIKPASTIQIIREVPNNGGVEVLLLRRNKALKFASGFWVYPGGKIEKDELDNRTELDAAKIAGARETMEEAQLQVESNDLAFCIHWTTPINEKRRFSTYFFHVKVDYDNSKVIVDDSEIMEHKWMSPKDAFKALQRKEIFLLPPTYITLQRIIDCQNYYEVKEEWNRSEPTFVNPIIGMDDYTVHCMYEGDAGYENGDFSSNGARHRLVVNYKKPSFTFVHENCQVFPLNGGKHLDH